MPDTSETQANSSVKTYVTLTFHRDLTASDLENLRSSSSALRALQLPAAVKSTLDRAQEWGFTKSSRPEVGLLLSVLAAAVPPRGRVLEIGTGAGVGLTWIVYGLGRREDVEVITVDLDPDRAASVRAFGWPDWVSVVTGDGATILHNSPGSFDLIFPELSGREDLWHRTIYCGSTAWRHPAPRRHGGVEGTWARTQCPIGGGASPAVQLLRYNLCRSAAG